MKQQIRETLVALAAALVLGACASTVPATHTAKVDLTGFVRVAHNGQELFCDKEKYGFQALAWVCYTRDQMKVRAQPARDTGAWLGAFGSPGAAGNFASIYTSYNASGH